MVVVLGGGGVRQNMLLNPILDRRAPIVANTLPAAGLCVCVCGTKLLLERLF